jgi:hypothetical protein
VPLYCLLNICSKAFNHLARQRQSVQLSSLLCMCVEVIVMHVVLLACAGQENGLDTPGSKVVSSTMSAGGETWVEVGPLC